MKFLLTEVDFSVVQFPKVKGIWGRDRTTTEQLSDCFDDVNPAATNPEEQEYFKYMRHDITLQQ